MQDWRSQAFPNKKIFKSAGLITLLLSIAFLHPDAPTIAVIVLSAWAIIGAKQAIQALSLMVLIKSLNSAITPSETSIALLCWIVTALAGIRILLDLIRTNCKINRTILWLLIFSLFIFAESLFISNYPAVSIFKVVSFAYAAVVVLFAFRLTALRGVDWTPWFLGIWIAVVVLSIPTYFAPEIGYSIDGLGFQGILKHPQLFASFLAPMAAWLSGKLFFNPSKSSLWL